MMGTPTAVAKWGSMDLSRYTLAQANDAVDAVQSGRVIKALIELAG